jgi:5'-methylthioadenosine phosphorylase
MEPPSPGGERLCLVYGHSLPPGEHPLEGAAVRVELEVSGEPIEAIDAGSVVGLPRHAPDRSVPAHLVDHHANVRAVCELGCDRVLALGSAGSLRLDRPVGTLVCPDDFFAPGVTPSFYDDVRGHSVPGFDSGWRARVVAAFEARGEAPFVDGGVYAQVHGPRFETPAEVRALARDADLVGMTIAAEAVLAREAGLAYAAVCTIDNIANGLEDEPLTPERYRRGRNRTAARLLDALARVLPELSESRR